MNYLIGATLAALIMIPICSFVVYLKTQTQQHATQQDILRSWTLYPFSATTIPCEAYGYAYCF